MAQSGPNWSQNVPKWPKMASTRPKMENFSVFFEVFGGFSGLRILLSYFWPAPLQRPEETKKSANYFFRPPMGPNPVQTTFYRN